jgi:IS5 family transposase
MMTGFERYTKKTRRAIFLEEMEQVVPWAKLCALIEPHYPKPGNGRRPKELEKMLRIYFLQQWFNLADPAVEEALYDSATLRQFAGIDLGGEPVPDETTVCKFRHLLEEHNLGAEILKDMLDLGPNLRLRPVLHPRHFVHNLTFVATASLCVVLRSGRALADHFRLSLIGPIAPHPRLFSVQ